MASIGLTMRIAVLAAAAGGLSSMAACSAPGAVAGLHGSSRPHRPGHTSSPVSHLRGPASAQFAGAAFPTASVGWVIGTAGGTRGRVWQTRTAGSAWSVQWRGRGNPLSVSAVGRRRAWVVVACPAASHGRSCRAKLLATGDSGRHWRVLARLPAAVSAVQFVSPTFGIATADKACPPSYPPSPCPGRLLASHDGGASWATVRATDHPVFATAGPGGQIWAAEAVAESSGGPPQSALDFTTSVDGGRSWQPLGQLSGLAPLGSRVRVRLAATPAGLAWASVFDPESCAMHGCGTAGLYSSADGGRTWVPATPGGRQTGCANNSIVYSAAPDGAVWAATGRNGAACAAPFGLLYRHTAAGWQAVRPWQLSSVTSLAAINATTAYAMSPNALARTDDGGRHWAQLLPAPAPAGQIDPLTATTAFAGQDEADAGAILRTEDGGRTWQPIADLPGILTQVDFPSADQGVAVTYRSGPRPSWRLWRSPDGGRTWQLAGRLTRVTAGNTAVYGPWMTRDGHGLLLTLTGAIPWQESGSGGTAPAQVWTTSDWGAHWLRGSLLPIGKDSLNGAVSFVPAGAARWAGWLIRFTSGRYEIAATADSGRTLAALPGSLPVDRVQLVRPGVGFAWGMSVTGRSGPPTLVLYRTTDNAGHWRLSRLVLATSPSAPPLLSFADASDGWLVIDGDTWHTADGGRSWRRA